ncbi:integrase, catalytic region, zinc finger, CCHC-type containing protein, partial [Tanacetum coccineum]
MYVCGLVLGVRGIKRGKEAKWLLSIVSSAHNPFYLKKAKVAQPALYDGNELINLDHGPIDIPSSEEDLELAKLTRQKMHEKLNDPVSSKMKGRRAKGQSLTPAYLATCDFTEVRAMKAVFEEMEAEVDQNAIDKKYGEIQRKNLLIKNENLIANCIAQDVFYTVTDSTLSASRFHDLSTAYNVAMNRVVELESENSRLLRKIEHDDHDTMIKAFSKLEVAHVNLQLKQQHLKENANNLKSKSPRDVPEFDVFLNLNNRHLEYKSLDSQNFQLKQTVTDLQNQLEDFKAENAKIKLHYQELFNSIKVTRAQTTEKAKSLQNEIENLRAQLKGKMPCVTSDVKTPKVSAFEKYAIDVEPIPPRLNKNREVHLHYIKRLKENVETLREIVEDAKVERPLDTSLASACRYTKHSQELLEYVIGTCPKDFGPSDKQNASTNSLRKKRVNFVEPCETSTHNTPPQVEHQKINSTNAPGIPSTGVKGASAASRSKPRSNTKKDRTLPAKSALKQVEAHARMNKSNETQKNRVDSSICYKRTIINLNSNTSCKYTVLKSDCMPADLQETIAPVVQIVLWYLDSGCSKHMTGDRSRLRNFVKKFIGTVRFGNDHFGAIMGYGDYVIGDSILNCLQKATPMLRPRLRGVDLYERKVMVNELYTIFVDNMMRFTWVKFLRSKDETPAFVINLLKQLQVGLNKTVKFVRTDNGTEFVNKVLIDYYEKIGITHEKTVPRTPQQNGVVKRRNCTLVEAARTILIFSKALLFLWAEAVDTAFYTQNRSLIHTLHDKTLYELMHDKKPDLSFLYIFGALCYPTNDSEDLGKLKAKADIGFFLGYAPNKKGYRIYNKRTRQIMEMIYVTFDELTGRTAPVPSSSGPAPNLLMPRPISSGLVPTSAPAIPYVPPTNKELELLFQMTFDEYFETTTGDLEMPPVPLTQ